MKYRYIMWDWNGTLLDDVGASLHAVNDMLKKYGKSEIGYDEYYSYIDTPIYKFYERIFDFNVVPMDILKSLFADYYRKYENTIKLADGAEGLLKECKDNGVKQYIVSAAHIDDISRYTKMYGIYDIFERIEGARDYDAGSKIEGAKRLMNEEGIRGEECVFIGDTLHDEQTAKELGIECILYSEGHTDHARLKKTGRIVCSSFEDIRKMI